MPKLQTFDGPQLDELLARVRREAGLDATIVQARKVRTGGFGGFFSKETFRVDVDMTTPKATRRHAPTAPTSPPAPSPENGPTSLLELAELVDEAEADAVEVTVPAEPAPSTVATVRAPAYIPSTERPTFNAVLNRIASEAGTPLPSPLDALDSFRGVTGTGAVHHAPRNHQGNHQGSKELLALGLPESMLPADMSPGMAVARLLQSLHLPATPPLPFQPGAVTVIVGERRAAARLAADVARELLLDKRDVWLADEGPEGRADRLSTPADAAAERHTWLDGPNVVALAAPPGARDLRWAESMLDALEPTTVWGVVGADRKTEDIAAWSDALGGIDALALEHLDRTTSPASVLQLGIPVARIDRQKATPALWAVLLAERLAA